MLLHEKPEDRHRDRPLGTLSVCAKSPENPLNRPAMISRLIDESIERKLIANFLDNGLIVSGIFQATTSNVCWFRLLKLTIYRLNHLLINP